MMEAIVTVKIMILLVTMSLLHLHLQRQHQTGTLTIDIYKRGKAYTKKPAMHKVDTMVLASRRALPMMRKNHRFNELPKIAANLKLEAASNQLGRSALSSEGNGGIG